MELPMFIRRAFTVFLEVQSEAQPPAVALADWTPTRLALVLRACEGHAFAK
jgi:hypothetical protein